MDCHPPLETAYARKCNPGISTNVPEPVLHCKIPAFKTTKQGTEVKHVF